MNVNFVICDYSFSGRETKTKKNLTTESIDDNSQIAAEEKKLREF